MQIVPHPPSLSSQGLNGFILKCELANLEAKSQPGFVPATSTTCICSRRNASRITVVLGWVGGGHLFTGQRGAGPRPGDALGASYAASVSTISLSNHTKQNPKPCNNPFSWLDFLSPYKSLHAPLG